MWRAAGIYLVAALVLTWPLAAHVSTRLGAVAGAGDPFLNLWILGWGASAWLNDPAGVLTGRVFDANIFHPAAGTLTFSDHLLLQSLAIAPVYGVTGNLTLAYNLVLLASLALSGLAMHALVRGVTGSERGAYIAGLAWACWPYRTAHLLHLQLQALYFLPLALLLLHRFAAARRWRDALGLGVVAALQAISSVYYGVIGALAIGVAAVALAVETGQWRARRYWSRLAVAAAVGAVLIAPVVWPYWITQQREGFGRNLFEAAAKSATLQSYTQVPHENWLYGAHGLLLPRAPEDGERDRRDNEHQMFPGVVLLVLAGVGAWKGWRTDSRPAVIAAAALVVLGVVLSLGPEGAGAIYAWTADVVFGFHAIRAPTRFAVVAMAGACLLAGIGIARANMRRALVAGLAVAMMAEYVNAPLALVAAPDTHAADRWIAARPEPGAVLYLPLSLDKDNTPFMVRSLAHRRPIVNGYSGQRPSFYTSLVDAFADPASVAARAMLAELDVQFVVAPAPLAFANRRDSPYVERETFGDEVIYEVVWTAESEAALGVGVEIVPPPPGPVPFAVGEQAAYDVQWLTGPLDVSAGTILLAVVAPEAGDRGADGAAPAFAFEATAETAPWVSQFFEAEDRFRTSATSALVPLVHQRMLREGRREVDRAYVYDAGARHVRSANSVAEAHDVAALALPLAAHARDSLTALWYLRTLPLAPGFTVQVPINEAGRSLSATITVSGEEMVDTPGGPRRAFRVEPRLATRVQRRQAVEATIWISADDARLPLAAEITAGFGSVRLELVDYRP